jgi:aminoglycoside 6'-N-acetyltransferase
VTRLRPITAADVDFLDSEYADPEATGEYAWFGFRAPGRRAEQVARGESIGPDGGRLAVVDDDGSVVGEISWRTVLNGPPGNGECWQVGIWIAPGARGRGHGSAAQRQLADYLFANTTRERVEAGTELGNLREQKALENAGFTREGVLRRAWFRGGGWRDVVLYSKLRGE